ncbi:MAG: T9SS type A sorting domain-containing protein [Bacteroidota bacterium]
MMMNRAYTILLWCLFLLIFHAEIRACGFGYIGSCSSNIHLKINNTPDSFDVAPCPFSHQFDGLNLGTIQSLAITQADFISWESCQNNVTGLELKYRVYPANSGGGAWQSFSCSEIKNIVDGPYTTRYFSGLSNLNLSSGLTIGQDYVLEIYFKASVDTIGDDFIPETYFFQNNNGQNYRMQFRYGGAGAPPFTVAPTTLDQVSCTSPNSGRIGVSVYGDQSGLFYQWSNVNNNFPIQFNLPAGTYTVTVSGSSGYTQTQTFILNPPVSFERAENAEICKGQTYHRGSYQFATSGVYDLYLPAQIGCDTLVHLQLQVLDPALSLAALPEQATISCATPSLNFCATPTALTSFVWQETGKPPFNGLCYLVNYSGVYTVTATQTGNTAVCNASKQITVSGNVDPPTVITTNTPIIVGCQSPDTIWVFATAITNAVNPTFQWVAGDHLFSTADTCLFPWVFQAGYPQLNLIVTDQYGCTVDRQVFFSIQQANIVSVYLNTTPCTAPDHADGQALVEILGGTPPFTVLWSNGAQTTTIYNLLPGSYCVTVTDQTGCYDGDCITVTFTEQVTDLNSGVLSIVPNLTHPGSSVMLHLPDHFQVEAYQLALFDEQGKGILSVPLEAGEAGIIKFDLPQGLKRGVVYVQLTSAHSHFVGQILVF